MNAWFVVAYTRVMDSKFGPIEESAMWDASAGDWTSSIATAYRTQKDAEAVAFYLSAALYRVARVVVLHFDEMPK